MYHVPKDKRALRSAENLYQGLREVLKSKTFKEVTVSDLQKASGISRSTFYRLFDNPSDLLEWKLDSCLDEVFQAVPAARRSLDLEIIRQFFTYLISQQELLDLLDDIRHPSLSVSGMAHILPVKVRSRVFVAKCREPQAESREAGVKEAV